MLIQHESYVCGKYWLVRKLIFFITLFYGLALLLADLEFAYLSCI